MTAWTDERVELLKKMWAYGWSAAGISDALGNTSRNAVIGKVYRLGLAARVQASSQPKQAKKPRKPRKPGPIALNGHVGFASQTDNPIVPSLPPERIEDQAIPIGQRCTIMDLTMDTCKWPIGDPSAPDFFFCGGKTWEGLPYCGYHSRIAYQPASPRQGKREAA